MAKLTDEQRRALQLLARSPNGCTEALMMAHGFEGAMLGQLVVDGLALATPHHSKPCWSSRSSHSAAASAEPSMTDMGKRRGARARPQAPGTNPSGAR
jgi:hypothetical protein